MAVTKDFYSHAPRGARPAETEKKIKPVVISTHTPLAGRDVVGVHNEKSDNNFYSHAPRGARHRTICKS